MAKGHGFFMVPNFASLPLPHVIKRAASVISPDDLPPFD